MESEQLLIIENLHVSLGGLKILRGINLNIRKGEIVCLVGRNGAGKTTTLKSIMRLVPINEGKIIFNGVDITSFLGHKVPLLGIGYAPEDRQIFTELSVEDNIRLASWQLGDSDEEFDRKLEEITEIFPEIKKLLDRKGQLLSGGEQKMVAVARALALNPKLLLLDEPFEGLAPSAVDRLAESIRKIAAKGISILVAESNINHAIKIANRIYVIERGEIIGHVTEPERIFENKDLALIVCGAL